MTPSQNRKYWGEWNKALKAMQRYGRGRSKAEADAERKAIHEQVNAPESSRAFRERDLDSVLAVFYSWSKASDIMAQARQIEQPVKRCRFLCDALLDRIAAIFDSLERPLEADPIRPGKHREGYLLAMLRRLNKPEAHKVYLEDYSASAWQKIVQALHYRYDQVSRKPEQGGPSTGRGAKRRRPYDLPSAKRTASNRRDRTLAEAPVDDDADPF